MSFLGKSKKNDAFKHFDEVQKLTSKRDVRGFIKMLERPDDSAKIDAAKALGEIGDPQAVDALINALADDNSNVRGAAADSLGSIRDPKAVDVLMKVLKDDANASVRFSAAHALGYIGDPKASQVLVEALTRGCPASDGTTHVDFAAGDALRMIGGPQVADALIGCLGPVADADPTGFAVRRSVKVLGEIGDQRAVDVLIEFIATDRGNALARNDAIQALDKIGGAKADDFLDNTLLRSKDAVRGRCTMSEAAAMLKNLGGGSTEQSDQA